MTQHEYDRAGRLVRSVTRREAEWDDEQAAWMLALAEYRTNLHSECGGYLPETTAPGAEDGYRAEPPVRCHLCTERGRAVAAFADGGGKQMEALLWPVRRRG